MKWYNELKENEFNYNGYEPEYEYDVVTLFDKNEKRIDQVKLNKILNDHAKVGWRLHTIYSNEVSKHETAGREDYFTLNENIIVFERKLKKE